MLKYDYYRTIFPDLDEIKHSSKEILYIIAGRIFGSGLHRGNLNLLTKINANNNHLFLFFFHRGISKSLFDHMYKDIKRYALNNAIEKNVDSKYSFLYYRRFGARIAERYRNNILDALDYINDLSNDRKEDVFYGFAKALRSKDVMTILNENEHRLSIKQFQYVWERYGKVHWSGFYKADQHLFQDIPAGYIQSYLIGYYELIFDSYLSDRMHTSPFMIDEARWEQREVLLMGEFEKSVVPFETQKPLRIYAFGVYIANITFGRLSVALQKELFREYNNDQIDSFYSGYGRGLFDLFGADESIPFEYIEKYVPQTYRDSARVEWEAARQ
jgi:hypothetical protein